MICKMLFLLSHEWSSFPIHNVYRFTFGTDMETFTTNKGKPGIIHEQYSYRLDKEFKRSNAWRCTARTCTGRISTNKENTSVLHRTEHNHGPGEDSIKKRRIRALCKRRAAEDLSGKTSKFFLLELGRAEALSVMTSQDVRAARQVIYRERRKTVSTPQTAVQHAANETDVHHVANETEVHLAANEIASDIPQCSSDEVMAAAKGGRLTFEAMKKLVADRVKGPGYESLFNQMKVVSGGDGKCSCELKVSPQMSNVSGTLHGGVTASLVDAVSTYALTTTGQGKQGVSIDLNVSYLRAAKLDEVIIVSADTLKCGKTIAVCTVDIINKETGQLLAQGRHSKFIGDSKPSGSKLRSEEIKVEM